MVDLTSILMIATERERQIVALDHSVEYDSLQVTELIAVSIAYAFHTLQHLDNPFMAPELRPGPQVWPVSWPQETYHPSEDTIEELVKAAALLAAAIDAQLYIRGSNKAFIEPELPLLTKDPRDVPIPDTQPLREPSLPLDEIPPEEFFEGKGNF